MTRDLISCIVPVFNGERYLGETLDSILAQTYQPLEIIVADDGSTDRTAQVVASYGEKVHYVKQANAGGPAARNLGLKTARGKFIAFLDADDLWSPDKLEHQMACFDACPALDLCITHVQNFWIPELAEEAERYQNHRHSKPLPGYVLETLLAKRSAFERIGMFDPTWQHADKTAWFLRAKAHGCVIELLPDVLVHRRIHRTNQSRVFASTSRDEYLRLIKATLDQRRSDKIGAKSGQVRRPFLP